MLSPSKSIMGSNYGEFLKDKNVLLCTRLQVRSEFGKFAYTANTQLIWSSGIPFVVAVNLI
jgi:hypothetical protein